MANPFGSFDIPQLRKQSVMQDWSTPIVDYSGGEMPVNYPPPSVGPVQDGAFPGMFGREYTPSMTGAQPTGPTAGAPPSQVAPPQVNTYDPDRANREMMDAIGKVYTPETVDRDRLRSLMDAAPERESPGWGRGLSAIAMGIGTKDPTQALANMEAINYAPHRRAMADWTAKSEPFYKTAELENRANVNERTLAGNVVKSVSDDRRLEQTRIRDEGKQAVAEERNRIAGIHAQAAEARANNWIVKIDGDRVRAYPPRAGMGEPHDLGPSRGMTTEDKIRLEGQFKVAAAAEAAKAGQTRAEIGQAREFTDPEGNVWVKKPGSEPEPSGLPKGSVPSSAPRASTGGGELEKDRVEQNKLQGMFEQSDPNVIRGTNGKFELKKRPKLRDDSWFPGDQSVTQAQLDAWDASKKQVDPTYVPPKSAAAPPKPREAAPDLNFSNLPSVTKPAGSTKGLGPPNVPKVGDHVTAGAPITSSTPPSGVVKTQSDPANPKNKRRTADGGKTWEYSTDGGITWSMGGV